MATSYSTPIKFMSLSVLLISMMMMVCEVNGQLPRRETTLVYYLQDRATEPNATVAPVVGIRGRDWNYNTFGTIFVVDDPVRVGPSPLSTEVGRAQGMLVVSAHDARNVNVVLSIVFNDLEYRGSTLELQGLSRQRENYKEISVVSGTGRFRFVRGFAVLQTALYDAETAQSIVRLTLTLRQY
ncbi:hypothetical protein VNO77_36777 [Canavalia gladiata]|uniref:Dirigent protein n=1 Tax=Canavalia gladiata TaxID=3824 RepID=A0AAN9K874_CANGL